MATGPGSRPERRALRCGCSLALAHALYWRHEARCFAENLYGFQAEAIFALWLRDPALLAANFFADALAASFTACFPA
jgi:hypothetical protein